MANRREFLYAGALSALGALGSHAAASGAPNQAGTRDRAAALPPLWIDGLGVPGGLDPGKGSGPLTDARLSDLRDSSLTAVNVTVSHVGNGMDAFERTLFSIADHERELARHPARLMKIRSTADLQIAREHRRFGLIYGFQDTSPIGSDLKRLDLFHALGVRIVQLTYNNRNLCGDGCLEPADGGISRFGRDVVEELARLGVVLDLSHASPRTIGQSIAHSRRPCLISHSACRDLVDRPRNTYDRHMRQLADKGGVFGIYFMPFLRNAGQPTGEDLIRHIEHAVAVCGEDHVSVGTDGFVSPTPLTPAYRAWHREFVERRRRDGVVSPGEDPEVLNLVPEFNRIDRFQHLAERLQARGHSGARIDKILGLNLARVMSDVWQ